MTELKILTLNCWGLKYVSKDRHERINAIANYLASSAPQQPSSNNPYTDHDSNSRPSTSSDDRAPLAPSGSSRNSAGYDIVALQEVWVRSDGDKIAHAAQQAGLTHSRWWHAGAFGSGLMILSRFPIIQSKIHRYSLNGKPLRVIEGDWFVGKSAASVVLDLASVQLGQAEVFTTHFYSAPGDHIPDEWLRAHRLSQAYELGCLARDAARAGRHAFVVRHAPPLPTRDSQLIYEVKCGDLNSVPSSLVMRVLTGTGELQDAWLAAHPITTSSPSTPAEAIARNGVTCDSPVCSYTLGKKLSPQTMREYGKRLDYVLYRPPELPDRPSLTCAGAAVALTGVLLSGVSYSDHFGVEAAFTPASDSASPRKDHRSIGKPLSSVELTTVHAAFRQYLSFARREARHCLFGSLGTMVVSLVLLPLLSSGQVLGDWDWLLVILGALSGAACATFLYVGLLAGRIESGALTNLIQEVESRIVELQVPA